MGWLDRIRHVTPRNREPEKGVEASPPEDRASPGIAAFFGGIPEDGGRLLLDLGHASESHLRIFGRFARRIRFAGLLPLPPLGDQWVDAVESLPSSPGRPYDLVLAWDLLDRVGPEARPRLVRRLAEITAPDARLYTVVNLSGASTIRPLRFTLLDLEHVRQEVAGPPLPSYGQLLPAPLERLLSPFTVVHAFTLRSGLREYVAMKGVPQ